MPDKDDRKELVEGAKPFSRFLEMLHDGEFHWECSETPKVTVTKRTPTEEVA